MLETKCFHRILIILGICIYKLRCESVIHIHHLRQGWTWTLKYRSLNIQTEASLLTKHLNEMLCLWLHVCETAVPLHSIAEYWSYRKTRFHTIMITGAADIQEFILLSKAIGQLTINLGTAGDMLSSCMAFIKKFSYSSRKMTLVFWVRR